MIEAIFWISLLNLLCQLVGVYQRAVSIKVQKRNGGGSA